MRDPKKDFESKVNHSNDAEHFFETLGRVKNDFKQLSDENNIHNNDNEGSHHQIVEHNRLIVDFIAFYLSDDQKKDYTRICIDNGGIWRYPKYLEPSSYHRNMLSKAGFILDSIHLDENWSNWYSEAVLKDPSTIEYTEELIEKITRYDQLKEIKFEETPVSNPQTKMTKKRSVRNPRNLQTFELKKREILRTYTPYSNIFRLKGKKRFKRFELLIADIQNALNILELNKIHEKFMLLIKEGN
jgi:hypothetical protein